MNTKIGNAARIRRTTVLAAGLWVTLALMLTLATLTLDPQVGAEAAPPNGAAEAERSA